jgi:SET domain-containing protein
MNSRHLIAEAHNDVYCKLAPSPIHGVGVFALKDIPPNTIVFRLDIEWVKIPISFLNRVNSEIAALYKQFLRQDIESETIYVPQTGFSSIGINFYLNHSTTPNCKYDIESNFIISKDQIYSGQELTYDYRVHGYRVEF